MVFFYVLQVVAVSRSEDNYISKYNCLENTKIFGQVFNVGFTGLITAGRVEKLISDLR